MNYQDKSLQSLKLGQATEYAANYDRTLLQPVPRKLNRDGLGITEQQKEPIFGQPMKFPG